LRHHETAQPDPGHRDAERQPAPTVEPGGDRLGIAERGLDRTGPVGEREKQDKDQQ